MDRVEILRAFYEGCDEDGRLRSKHGQVEFLTTMRYVERYLAPGGRVIEIGAGTGRYSHALARKGYEVDAVELVEHNMEIFRRNTAPGERVNLSQGDALDLSAFPEGAYDAVLLLGPLYHLYTPEDQRRALCEAIRVAKPGGVIFAAYCGNDATVVQECFCGGLFEQAKYRALVDMENFHCQSVPEEVFSLLRREDIDARTEGLPVERLHFVGTDMLTYYVRDAIDALSDEVYALYLRYHWTVCERPDMVGVSNHFLDVFRKL